MLDPGQLRRYVVEPTLKRLGLWSLAAEQLVMGTAAQESALVYVHQLGGGPALGLWQMEPATHNDIWRHWLINRTELAPILEELASAPVTPVELPGVFRELHYLKRPQARAECMVGNLFYACAMCRIHYRRRPEPLPPPYDVQAMAEYWKAHYNTYAGAGEPLEFVAAYTQHIAPIYGKGET